MKKFLAVLLAALMILALAGCGGAAGKGKLRVGVKNSVYGFGYQDTLTGEYSGMEIDLAELIAKELGYEGVEFTAVTAATRTELLDSGELDCVIATFTINDERKQSWDFTTPYYTDVDTVLVENSSGIKTLEDLLGKTIGVASGSTAAKALVTAMVDKGYIPAEAFDPETFDAATWTEGIAFSQFDDYPAVSTALAAGTVNAFCVDKSILSNYMNEGRSYIEDSFSPQNYGVATKKGAELSGQIEALITKWLADGTIDGLIDKWGIR